MNLIFKVSVVLTFLGGLATVQSLAPGILGYNPLKSRGYEAKSDWKEIYPPKEVSAVVAEFTSSQTTDHCSRVVMFTAKGCKLKFLKVPCNTFRLTLGLVYVDDVLWFYGMAMAKRVTEKGDKQQSSSTKYQVVIVTEFDKSTCRKTVIDEKDLSRDPTADVKYVLDETVKGEGPAADEDCKNLIQMNIPPMILLSSEEGAKVRDPLKFGPSSFFNPKELVGAATKVFMDGMVCFRIVRFYSKGRPLNAIRTTCGPVQGMLMTEKSFRYGRTVMVTVDDKDPDVFTMVINRFNGRISRSKIGIPPNCEKRIFKLVKIGQSYDTKIVSTIKESELSAECKDLINGNLQDPENIYQQADANVDQDVSKKLEGYTKASVCVESKLRGSITIGSMTIIHPKATIIAEAGPIVIGENNIIEEQASIIYRSADDVEKENAVQLNIGVNNVFEVGCEVHAKSIGDHNVFESKCYVGPNVEIGNGCIIGAGGRLTVAEKLPDLTVITGRECVRRVAVDKPPAQTLQIDFLSKILPNYHHLRKPNRNPPAASLKLKTEVV